VWFGTRTAVCVAVFVSCVGCDASDRAARGEAAAVSRAIDAVRAADNANKSAPLAALRSVPCSVGDVCGVRSFCIAAYEQHELALGLVAQAKAELATAPVANVAATIASAESGLSRAKTLTDDCTSRQGEMARRYHVAR
jgi:hypothetical protein